MCLDFFSNFAIQLTTLVYQIKFLKMHAKKFKSVFLLTIMLGLLTISSCKKEDVREDYIGSYRTNYEFTYNGSTYNGTYTLTIVKSSTNENDIILNNISDLNESARATVNGTSMTIPQQTIKTTGISGSGTLNGNVLNFSTQEIETGGATVNVTHVATKQ